MKSEKPMKAIIIIALAVAAAGCAQFPICPEIKLAMCPAQEGK